MFFDADDYVGNDISAYVNSRPDKNGWIMAHGYRMAKKHIAPFYLWSSICGTGNIFNFSLLSEFLRPEVTEKSTQNEIFESIDSEFLITIGRHDRARSFFEKRGQPFLEYPTRSVIHRVEQVERSESTRETISGRFDHHLNNARKVGEISPITSTKIGYFNILPSNAPKVFCLGFQKTGTTSVDWVLQDMGYQVAKAYKQADKKFTNMLKNGDLSEIKTVSKLFDAFQDIPWFNYYREYDKLYPGSKFILTTRDSQSWWKSFLRFFRTEHYPLFEYVYGSENPIGHKKRLIARFESHNREVIEYFKDRPDDLLVMAVGQDDALQNITKFLGRSSSYEKMPHKNALRRVPIAKRKINLKRWLKILSQVRLASLVKILTFSKPPIIIGGCRKSGVELLLSILSCHPKIHTLRNVKLKHPSRHPLTPEADRVANNNQSNPKNLFSPFDLRTLYLKMVRMPIPFTANRWCGASPLSILAYDRILNYFGENVRILNIVRDGRDVVAETDRRVMEKRVVSEERWVHDVKAGLNFSDHPQVLTIRYEDLIRDYEKTINHICEFIGDQDPTPLLNYPKGAKHITPRYWLEKWQQKQFSERVEDLLQTPGALECLRHYGYIG